MRRILFAKALVALTRSAPSHAWCTARPQRWLRCPPPPYTCSLSQKQSGEEREPGGFPSCDLLSYLPSLYSPGKEGNQGRWSSVVRAPKTEEGGGLEGWEVGGCNGRETGPFPSCPLCLEASSAPPKKTRILPRIRGARHYSFLLDRCAVEPSGQRSGLAMGPSSAAASRAGECFTEHPSSPSLPLAAGPSLQP